MRKLILFTFLIYSTSAVAQISNAILFTENGERFQVVLNGILQNSNPETNVKLTELTANHYKCKIVFFDKKLGYVDFNMFFPEQGNEVTWNIKKNNKGEYVTRFVSTVPIAQAPVAPANQSIIIYSATTPAVSTTTTTVQQSHTSVNKNDAVDIHIGINAGDEGANVSMHASGMNTNPNELGNTTNSTTTTTRTVTTTTTSPGEPQLTPSAPMVVYVSGYTGKIGCPIPLNPNEFSEIKESIQSKDFENTRLTIAKQIIQNNCLTSSQVKEILGIFDFENTKLEFAKYAYDRTYDINNYYKVNDAFEFENSIQDLNKYINSRK